jgi:RNA polymerase sigma-B factor
MDKTCRCRLADCHDSLVTLASAADSAVRATLRHRIVEAHLGLAYSIAARYGRRGADSEDIRQVAALALVQAVDRFDPHRGTTFWDFAAPTVAGTIKRHFRDQTWMVHPPRPVKDLRLRIRAATDPLAQQLGRVPTVADLAEHLACSPQEASEALRTDDSVRPLSLDAPVRPAADIPLGAMIGCPDNAYAHFDNVHMLRPLLGGLSEREQRVLVMRFADGLTQSEIAKQIGCSQMQVCRILGGAFEQIRRGMQDRPAARTISAGLSANAAGWPSRGGHVPHRPDAICGRGRPGRGACPSPTGRRTGNGAAGCPCQCAGGR